MVVDNNNINNIDESDSNNDFELLFKNSLVDVKSLENNIVEGVVVHIDKDFATIDVGLKSEGKVSLGEFKNNDGDVEVKVGDEVEVYLSSVEGSDGLVSLSRERAKKEEVWIELEKNFETEEFVFGDVVKRIKGGFAVLVDGVQAFLPGSQLDVAPMKNINMLIDTKQELKILKMDKKRFNMVVSRKAVISSKGLAGGEVPQVQYEEGQTVEGVVKNITGYGVFVDLGHIDGLLHVTDISWSRINHPSEILHLGEKVKVKIIKINEEDKRISLGMKQLVEDPWETVLKQYEIGNIYTLKVNNLADYGIFLKLTDGAEGLVHVSEVSWTRKDINIRKEFNIGEDLTVKVLEIDKDKRRMTLSIKACEENPWSAYMNTHQEGEDIDAEVKEIHDSGLLVKLNDNLDSFIRLHNISWESADKSILENYSVGDKVKASIIKYDPQKDRINLGIKQLSDNPVVIAFSQYSRGDKIEGVVSSINDQGVEIVLPTGVRGFVRKYDLSSDRRQQKPHFYKEGQEIKGVIMHLNNNKTVLVSIKELDHTGRENMRSTKESLRDFNAEEAKQDTGSFFADAFAEAMNNSSYTDESNDEKK